MTPVFKAREEGGRARKNSGGKRKMKQKEIERMLIKTDEIIDRWSI